MTQVMKGIRVIEVAQFTFVPAAGGILADWGADVIKIEHPERGDSQRGFVNMGGTRLDPDRHVLIEHPNRGKRSVGIDLATAQGQDLLHDLVRTADVFLTNYLPSVRQKNRFDVEHIRAINPDIIYARGSAYGDKGPERHVGGFDGTAFWTRTGIGIAMTPEELDGPLRQGLPAFGDSIGGMNIAGGISAALFHRGRTGEAAVIDVSLMSTGWWASGAALALVGETGVVTRNGMPHSGSSAGNPFLGTYRTSDGGTIGLNTLTPGPYIRDVFTHVGLPDAADDPRFATAEALFEHWAEAAALLVVAFAKRPFAYWREHLKTMRAQWAPAQTLLDLLGDEQALANDMIVEVEMDDGKPMKLVRGPVQFDGAPTTSTRAPKASEHTELVLMEMGIDWDRIEALKAARAIA